MGMSTATMDGDVQETPLPESAAGEVSTLLAWLASRPDGIGMTLIRAGVTGVRCMSTECPIARYVTVVTGHEVLIGDKTVTVMGNYDGRSEVDLPARLGVFVDDFDSGAYPVLESVNVQQGAPPEKDTFWRDRNGETWIVTRVHKKCARLDALDLPDRFIVVGGDHLRWSMTYVGRNS